MKWPQFFLAAACAFTTVLILGFIVADISTFGGHSPAAAMRPKDVTMAYSCGYLDGISHAPITPPKHLDWCDEYTEIAHANGFNP